MNEEIPESPHGFKRNHAKPTVIIYNEAKAAEAYARYSALRHAERDDPSITEEECFQILLNDAFRAFETAFCAPNKERE